MRYRLYLDTSVLGALTDVKPPERAAASRGLLAMARNGQVIICVSALVFEEVERASPLTRGKIGDELRAIRYETLAETPESLELADYYIQTGVFAPTYRLDARHVALATVHEVDALVSWNYRHMVSLHRRTLVTGTNIVRGYRALEIVSPAEVIPDA